MKRRFESVRTHNLQIKLCVAGSCLEAEARCKRAVLGLEGSIPWRRTANG